MNTKGTIYARPRWAGMSPGIVTAIILGIVDV